MRSSVTMLFGDTSSVRRASGRIHALTLEAAVTTDAANAVRQRREARAVPSGLVYAVARLIHTSSRNRALLAIAVGCGGAAAARLEALQGVGQRRHVDYRSGAVICGGCVCALRHRQTQRWEMVIEGGRMKREVGKSKVG